jgi:hypothetical protein
MEQQPCCGGAGWFSCQQFSILHPSGRRVCGGGRRLRLWYRNGKMSNDLSTAAF